MANKVKFGLSKCYYAVATDDGQGNLTYGTPVAMPGAVSLSLDQEGELTPFYADNGIYFQSSVNNGYTGSLELALIPQSFRTDVLGEVVDTNSVLVEVANKPVVEFALLFQFEGDDEATRHCMYRCTASRPSVSGNTTEASIEPTTESIDLTVMPRISDNVVKAKCPESQTTQYAGWYSAVYEPAGL